jgi:F-type H+-transporting ATPase subunit delta
MKDTGRHFVNLLNMLERRNRLAVLTQLPAAFLVLHDEHHGRQRGLLETALPLIEGEKEALEASFSASTGKQVSLEVRQDASLLGGVRVTLAGTRYDGTARARLNAARKRLQEVELNIG